MEPSGFTYRATKDGRVRIAWRGRVVTTLAGGRAAAFLGRVRGAPPARVQLEMARARGNFNAATSGADRARGTATRKPCRG